MSEQDAPSDSALARPRRIIGLLALCTGCLTVVLISAWPRSSTIQLPEGISAEEYEQAAKDWRGIFRTEPANHDVVMLLAETALRLRQPEQAVSCFAEIPSTHERYGASARLQEGQILITLNDAVRAEQSLLEYLRLATEQSLPEADQAVALRWLTYLMAVQLRIEDRAPHLQRLIDLNQASIYDAKQRFFPTLLIWAYALGRARLQEFIVQTPGNLSLQIAQARYLTAAGELENARAQLQRLREQHPQNLEVLMASLELLYEAGADTGFEQICAQLPSWDEDEPWLLTRLRGEYHLRKQSWETAAARFQHVLSQDPADPASTMGLIRCLENLPQTTERAELLNQLRHRSLLLSRMRVQMSEAGAESPEAVLALADNCRELEMTDAAAALTAIAASMSAPQ